MIESDPAERLATSAKRPSRVNEIARGPFPTWMLASTLFVACSITETLFERSLATKMVPMPLARAGTGAGARASATRSAASVTALRFVFKLSVQIIEKNQQLSDHLVHLGGECLAHA